MSAAPIVLTNARIVLPDRVAAGNVVIRDGMITEIEERSLAVGLDLERDLLIPGLVELHTDHLETHVTPRPGVRWEPLAALQAHDSQMAASGITTVFDALRIGMEKPDMAPGGEMRDLASVILATKGTDRLRADHRIHLRCEISSDGVGDLFRALLDDYAFDLVSVMDHTPGQRQFVHPESYRGYYKQARDLDDAELDDYIANRVVLHGRNSAKNRTKIVAACRAAGIPLASHDDATRDHVEEAVSDDVRIAEFPTTLDAAEAAHEAGLKVLMGAPNVVRGGSHSGNVSALDLARRGLLDVLSSDYVPSSLLHGALMIAERAENIDLPQAIATVTAAPAEAAGLSDRGSIAVGMRADLVQVRVGDGPPVIRRVWSRGRRVA